MSRKAGRDVEKAYPLHIHLIPRRDGNVANPTGGLPGVIPERMDYTAEAA